MKVAAAFSVLLAGVALAAPAQKGTKVSVSRKARPAGESVKDRLAADKKRTIAKYAKLNGLASVHDDAADPLTNYQDELFGGSFTIGTQTFNVDFDTGSSDIWIRGDSSATNKPKTTGYKDSGKTFSDSYGDGSNVSGKVYSAPYSVGGITASSGYFGVATTQSGFDSDPVDGLFGLGWAPLSQIGSETNGNAPIDDLGLTSFGIYLSNSADGDNGELYLQGTNPDKYSGSFNYINLNSESYWQFSGKGTVAANGKSYSLSSTNAIADSGTTLIYIGTTEANSLAKALGATGSEFTIPCSTKTSGPDITFTLGGQPYVVPASVYTFDNGDGTCILGIQGGAESMGVAIYGDVLMRNYYTVFDITNKRVGFAPAVHNGKTTPTTSKAGPTTTTKTTKTTAAPTTTHKTSAAPTTTHKTKTTHAPSPTPCSDFWCWLTQFEGEFAAPTPN